MRWLPRQARDDTGTLDGITHGAIVMLQGQTMIDQDDAPNGSASLEGIPRPRKKIAYCLTTDQLYCGRCAAVWARAKD